MGQGIELMDSPTYKIGKAIVLQIALPYFTVGLFDLCYFSSPVTLGRYVANWLAIVLWILL